MSSSTQKIVVVNGVVVVVGSDVVFVADGFVVGCFCFFVGDVASVVVDGI